MKRTVKGIRKEWPINSNMNAAFIMGYTVRKDNPLKRDLF